MPFVKYSDNSKTWFFRCLRLYKDALANGTKKEIVIASLYIHAALSDVPKSYTRYVNAAYKQTVRKIPLTD
jgi:hypothetical protein